MPARPCRARAGLAIRLPVCGLLFTLLLGLSVRPAAAVENQLPPPCGMAVLASSIGTDFSPEELAQVVQDRGFSPVVIDWAWIAEHWDKTDFAALNKFLDLVAAQHVPLAAMYRPRFLDNPTVPIQVKRDGKPVVDHGAYICFSSPEARHWGEAWGTRILRKCPQINEIIIYDPLNQCECAACQKAGQGRPYANYDAVWSFLAEAKQVWQQQRPEVQLGVVFVSDTEFWKRGAKIVDIAHPFLFVNDEAKVTQDAARVRALKDILSGRLGSCLAKVTWGDNDKVSPERLAEFDRDVTAAGLPYFVWTYDTLFNSKLYDPEAVIHALNLGPDKRQWPTAGRTASEEGPVRTAVQNLGLYTPAQVARFSTNELIGRLTNPDPNYSPVAALNALIDQVKGSEGLLRQRRLEAIISAMNEETGRLDRRIACCQALGGIGDDRAVPTLCEALRRDERMRLYAAESLIQIYRATGNAAAHEGLLEAGRSNPGLREELAQRLEERTLEPDGYEAPAGPRAAYLPDQVSSLPAEVLLNRMVHPRFRRNEIPEMVALSQKAKEADPAAREQILNLVVSALRDKTVPDDLRWPLCYVLSGSEDERAVPDLINILAVDRSELVRATAAEGLADFALKQHDAAAGNALLRAAGTDHSPRVQEVLRRRLGKEATAVAEVEELAPNGPPVPPPAPHVPVDKPLPWPFPGGEEDQHIFNNYQQATDSCIHCSLDFIQPAGTPVKAVASGYVAAIFTNHPEGKTDRCFIVTTQKDGDEGWCYTHVDPDTYLFGVGGYVKQGQMLGKLVDLSVGSQPDTSHLDLRYVRFRRDASDRVITHALYDPLYFFDWKDTEPPVLQPLIFVKNHTLEVFLAEADGIVTVSGQVDVLATIADRAYPDQAGNLGVPVVMVSISDGRHTLQKLVLDHRGEVGEENRVKPLYLSREERSRFLNVPDAFPRFQMLRVMKTDGDGKITTADDDYYWDTNGRDENGKRYWPDGRYNVNVYAWDIAGNRTVRGAVVRVANSPAGSR